MYSINRKSLIKNINTKVKAESLYNRVLLLINRLKWYLNEIGGKLYANFY